MKSLQWKEVLEFEDEQGNPGCWCLEIDSDIYGDVIWITKGEEKEYNIEYLKDNDYVCLKTLKTINGAKRWVERNVLK